MAAGLALLAAGCCQHAEPRWLIAALPGSYPEVVYHFPARICAVALTIDDGVDPRTTPRILDVLAAHGARATFFLVSGSIAGNEALVRRIVAEGHEIGHHMTEDEVTVRLEDGELEEKFERAAEALSAYGDLTWFRPGSGRYDERVLALTRSHGLRLAMASVFPMDTVWENPERMSGYVQWMIEPGSIVVLHDVGGRGERTAATLELLLPALARRDYTVLSMSGLATAIETPPEAERPRCD